MKFSGLERFTFFISVLLALTVAQAEEPTVRVLVPGFTVQELPVKLSNANGLRFAPDGRLTVLGYDGRIHLLSDTNGDGLEDKDELFWDKPTITVPVGLVWGPEGLYVSSHGKVSLLKDQNGDSRADEEEVIADGWPATDVGSGGVDATAVTRDADGNIYFGLLTADYSNPYRIWKDGKVHYETNGLRGTIQKWSPKTKKLETVCTGIRVPFALGFNQAGDLFNTDQEGETWCPDGNPFDEFNHIMPGRNYGFPPRHPAYLPNLISEPPVVAFGPQHQSACGFVFNEPKTASHFGAAQKRFGPAWWEGNAFVAGESRGQIWRVSLVKTPSGYIGQSFPFARLKMLTTDVCLSPQGELYVSCHSGAPDWGTGPKGEGKIFKISYADTNAPLPAAVWAENAMEVRVAFDQPLHPSVTNHPAEIKIEFGDFISAADRYENLKPPYQVVKFQETFPKGKLAVTAAKLSSDKRTLILTTAPHPQAVTYALTIPLVKNMNSSGAGVVVDATYTLNGVEITRSRGTNVPVEMKRWFPHMDSEAGLPGVRIRDDFEFSRANRTNESAVARSQLKLPAGTNYLHFEGNVPIQVIVGSVRKNATKNAAGLFSAETKVLFADKPLRLVVRVETGAVPKNESLYFHVSHSSADDPTRRPLPFSAFLLPWAPEPQAPPPMDLTQTELAGGDYENGKNLFFGEKLKCASCHKIRGEGQTIAPDLSNLVAKDAAAILRDIRDPSATINPDYVAFNVSLNDGDALSGFIRSQKEKELTVLGVDGKETVVAQKNVKSLQASTVSLMPSGLLDALSENEIRSLLVFLSSEPPQRTPEEISQIIKSSWPGTNAPPAPENRKSKIENPKLVAWVASKQDHGAGQHDYPAVQKMWIELLNQSPEITATNAWEWPSAEQFAQADALVFYFWNHDWSAERFRQLDAFQARGGGVVVLHSGTIAKDQTELLAERFGLASKSGGHTKYLHAPFDLKLTAPESPITRGLPKQMRFLDEPYWRLIGDTNKVTILATVEQEEKDWPLVWTYEKGKGRVFASIAGHYTWTHEDPMYRILFLRGLAWAMGEEPNRHEALAANAFGKKTAIFSPK